MQIRSVILIEWLMKKRRSNCLNASVQFLVNLEHKKNVLNDL